MGKNDEKIEEHLDGLENDITYNKTGNEGNGVKTLKNPSSPEDKAYDQGGLATLHPTSGNHTDIKEAYVFTKQTILSTINDVKNANK